MSSGNRKKQKQTQKSCLPGRIHLALASFCCFGRQRQIRKGRVPSCALWQHRLSAQEGSFFFIHFCIQTWTFQQPPLHRFFLWQTPCWLLMMVSFTQYPRKLWFFFPRLLFWECYCHYSFLPWSFIHQCDLYHSFWGTLNIRRSIPRLSSMIQMNA